MTEARLHAKTAANMLEAIAESGLSAQGHPPPVPGSGGQGHPSSVPEANDQGPPGVF